MTDPRKEVTAMPTLSATRNESASRSLHLREEPPMSPHLAIALAIAHERQAHERELAARHRARGPRRSLRHQLGQSLIRLGERMAPESSHEPAWSR